MDLKLKDRVVLVTGAGQGIGNAGAKRFFEESAIVYAADINKEQLEQLRQEYPGGRMKPIYFDVTSEQSVIDGVAQIVKNEGRIDAFFHNAMSAKYINNHDTSITKMSTEVWEKIRTLVLDATFYCVKHVGQVMERQRKGSIVLTSTVDALVGAPGLDAYTAAKGGIVSLVRSAAVNLSPLGVRINSIAPGFVKTPAQMNFVNDQEMKDLHLMPIAEACEIADLALFLASDVSRIITGQTIAADAGWTCFKYIPPNLRLKVGSA